MYTGLLTGWGSTMVGQISGRVLLVDDDPLVRKLISGYLVAAGYVVRTSVDGLDALGKLRTGLPDLIISDLNMPRMSGIELLEVVRLRDRKTSALNPWGSQRMLLGEEGRLNRKFSLTGKNGLTWNNPQAYFQQLNHI